MAFDNYFIISNGFDFNISKVFFSFAFYFFATLNFTC